MKRPDDSTVIVIGGGPCGAIAARQLLRAGCRVTMLDAGRRAPRGIVVRVADRTVLRWVERRPLSTDRHVGATDPTTEWYSSHSFGGLTNYWTGAVPRFAPEDFTEGARLDERYRWPIGYDDLVPFYEAAEDLMDITAGAPILGVPSGVRAATWPLPDDWAAVASAAARQHAGLGAMPLVKGRPWMLALRPNEFTSYHGIVRRLRRDPSFTLVPGARVLHLDYSESTGAVVSATVADARTGERTTWRGRAFFVAAGSLDSTEILLRSVSATFPDGLGNAHDVLGRYLHDHPREWWPAHLGRAMTALAHPLYLSRAPYESSPPLLAAGLTVGLRSSRDRLRTFTRSGTEHVGVQVFGTMVPSPEARVTVVGEPTEVARGSTLAIDLRYDEPARRNIEAARQRFGEVLAAAGLPVEIGPFHELRPGSSVHYGGTARMHDDPQFGVVDGWNRVHGVENVVVGDASCFTTGAEKNPTLTAMAIAARAARQLAESVAR